MNHLDGLIRRAEGLRRADVRLTKDEARAVLHATGLGRYHVDQQTLNSGLRKLRIIGRVGT